VQKWPFVRVPRRVCNPVIVHPQFLPATKLKGGKHSNNTGFPVFLVSGNEAVNLVVHLVACAPRFWLGIRPDVLIRPEVEIPKMSAPR